MDLTDIFEDVKLLLGYIDTDETIDKVIALHIATVGGYMRNAGITEEEIKSGTGVGTVAMGVKDLMNNSGGDGKFSKIFITMVAQLKYM